MIAKAAMHPFAAPTSSLTKTVPTVPLVQQEREFPLIAEAVRRSLAQRVRISMQTITAKSRLAKWSANHPWSSHMTVTAASLLAPAGRAHANPVRSSLRIAIDVNQ